MDELVWKRSILESLGLNTDGNGNGRRHVAPFDFLVLRDGRNVNRQSGEVKETSGSGSGSGSRVFDEVNMRALGERLGVWERAVRARPSSRG